MNGIQIHSQNTAAHLRHIANEYNFQAMLAYLAHGKNSKILDAGCGDGDFSELLAQRLQLTDIYGVDMDTNFLKAARSKNITVKKADIQKRIPFPSAYFDTIVSRQVIEHLLNPDSFLKECHRVLKNSGTLIITTPNLACWLNRLIFLFGIQPFFLESSTIDKTVGLKFTRKFTSMREPMGHIRVFTLGAIKDILALNGFTVLKVKGVKINYLPDFLSPFDKFFSHFPSLASDMVISAKKRS